MNITISRIWVINVTHSLHLSPISHQHEAREHSPAAEHNRYITVTESRAKTHQNCAEVPNTFVLFFLLLLCKEVPAAIYFFKSLNIQTIIGKYFEGSMLQLIKVLC